MKAPSGLAGGVRGWSLGETDCRRFPPPLLRRRRGAEAGAGEQLTHTPVTEEKEGATSGEGSRASAVDVIEN